jgi:hypothetical protein
VDKDGNLKEGKEFIPGDTKWYNRQLTPEELKNFIAASLAVCRTSCVKPQKIADQAIFYPANSESSPIIGDFLRHQAQKIHKCNRLLADTENSKAYIGTITHEARQRIKDVSGKIMSNIMLESGNVRHCMNKPSHNLRENDLLLIPDIINMATDIRVSDTMNQNNECLELKKDINGEITLIVEARVNYGGWLSLVTIYRKKK